MQWLLTAHVRGYHRRYASDGRVWQGRFKAFPIQDDHHLNTVRRYVERNPLRARLVARAELWAWSSLGARCTRSAPTFLVDGPVPSLVDWTGFVNEPMTAAEVEAVRKCVARGAPFGDPGWEARTAGQLGVESAIRPIGRPLRG
jgi:putative transposase